MESSITRQVRSIIATDPNKKHLAEALQHVSNLPEDENLKTHLKSNTLKSYKSLIDIVEPFITEINGVVESAEGILGAFNEMTTQL